MELNFELKSEKTFEETLVSLVENLKNEAFGVLWEFDLKAKLLEKGLPFESNCRILEVCNPQRAKAVLDINLDAAYFLPCKIAVIEKADGVYVGMIRPSLMMELLGDQDLLEQAHEVERHLKRAIMETV
jgi:uncharacterized protein (DUF302 family)